MPKNKRHGIGWDQLQVGFWVVVLRDFNLEQDEDDDDDVQQIVWGLFGPQPASRRKPHEYDGYPWKIMAMSYPFLAVTDGKRRYSIDFRRFDLQVVTATYAKTIHETTLHEWKKAVSSKKEQKRMDQIQKEEEAQVCGRCGTRMQSQRLLKPGSGEWAYFCPICDGLGNRSKLK